MLWAHMLGSPGIAADKLHDLLVRRDAHGLERDHNRNAVRERVVLQLESAARHEDVGVLH